MSATVTAIPTGPALHPASSHPSLPSCSLVVEWENTRFVENAGTQQMLKLLAAQVATALQTQARDFELLVAFDPGQADEANIRRQLHPHWQPGDSQVSVKLLPLPDCSYYVLKNRAAALAQGEIVAFIDCDVLPQAGWLAQILAPFSDPAVGVCQGATYVQPSGAWTQGLALAWLFPLLQPDGQLSESHRVIANNIAFRRSVLLQHPYPELPTWRGQCSAQHQQLKSAGVGIHWASGARTVHPFPPGLLGTLERACLNGHDHATRHQLEGGSARDWRASYWRFRSLVRRSRARRQQQWAQGLAPLAPAWLCASLAIGYWGCALLSECLLHLAPQFWRRQLKDLPLPMSPAAARPRHSTTAQA